MPLRCNYVGQLAYYDDDEDYYYDQGGPKPIANEPKPEVPKPIAEDKPAEEPKPEEAPPEEEDDPTYIYDVGPVPT